MRRKSNTEDIVDRHRILEELVKKADTPEQVHLLMEMNVDRTAGLLQEIYELRGQVQGYRTAFEKLVEEVVYWKKDEN
jgi:hypothetical protein